MEDAPEHQHERLWSAILWTLRVTVALQCLGNWRWMTQLEETPLLHWMLDPADIGGLAWKEATALVVQQVIGWYLLLAAGWVLWRPQAAVLVSLVVFQLLVTIAMWRIGEGYPLDVSWISPRVLTLFPFLTQLVRIVAPLGLLLVGISSTHSFQRSGRVAPAMQLLRWAIAIVFFAHGVEALKLNPKFLDLLINSTYRLSGHFLAQSTAERLLFVIGMVDVVIAALSVCFRWRAVMGWIAFWGGVTALSRIVANGWGISWHEAFTRIPHLGVPLAVVLWWHLLKCKAAADNGVGDKHEHDQGT